MELLRTNMENIRWGLALRYYCHAPAEGATKHSSVCMHYTHCTHCKHRQSEASRIGKNLPVHSKQ